MDVSQLEEFIKCKDDPVYFIEKYYGETLQKYQQNIIKNKENVFIDTENTFDVHTTLIYFIVHRMLFSSDITIGVYLPSTSLRKSFIYNIYKCVESLSFILDKPNIVEINTNRIEFDNGNRIVTGTQYNSFRGMAFNMLMVVDTHRIDNLEEAIQCLYPCFAHAKHAKLVLSGDYESLNISIKEMFSNLKQLKIT